MLRLVGRPTRIVTGPLRAGTATVRNPVPAVYLALLAAAITAGLALTPRRSPPEAPPVAGALSSPSPDIRVISTAGERGGAAASAPAVPSAAGSAGLAEPARPAIRDTAAPASRPAETAAEPSPFRLDALPVLETAGDDLVVTPGAREDGALARN